MEISAPINRLTGGVTMVTRHKAEGESYAVPARLVHGAILAIITACLATAGTISLWTINDARHEAAQDHSIATHSNQIANGILPKAAEQQAAFASDLKHLKGDVGRMENDLDRIEKKVDLLLNGGR